MKTELTERLGIEHPIILPGMTYISTPELVAAVSNAGGLGLLATGRRSTAETRAMIHRVRELTDKPFGVGLPLILPGAKENARVALEDKVPVINYSLGKGDWITEEAHRYGAQVIATVVTEKHALAACRYGADAIQATGHEAAAHGGAVTSLVLVPRIADLVDIPVIATGGFVDGRGLAAALSLGAQGIAMGSRLAISQESPVHLRTKGVVLQKTIHDTLYTDQYDGMDCRVMSTPATEKIFSQNANILTAFSKSLTLAKQMNISWLKMVTSTLLRGPKTTMQLAMMANASETSRLAIEEGDLDNGVQLIGQGLGLIEDLPTASEIIERVVSQAESVFQQHSS